MGETAAEGAPAGAPANEDAGSKRLAILRATIEVVAAQGPRAMTFRSVADRAGVSNPLVAYYFGSRENLLREASSWATDYALEIPRRDPGFLIGPDFPKLFVDHLESWIDLQIFLFESALEGVRSEDTRVSLQREINLFLDTYHRELRELVPEGGLVAAADLVYASLEGISLMHITHRDRARSEGAVRQLQRLLPHFSTGTDSAADPA